jgi:hypothetical protein
VNKNPLYSISLGVASLQDDSVGVVTALSPATVGHFKFYLLSSIVGLGLVLFGSINNQPERDYFVFPLHVLEFSRSAIRCKPPNLGAERSS